MTDNAGGGGPFGPPWSVDVLADLHAGVLDSAMSASLWPRVNADPEARAVIDALDTVKIELGHLGSVPVAPMPAHFAAKLDAALAAEANRGTARQPAVPGAAPVVDLAEARRRRNRRMGWGAGVLTAAAAAVAVTVAVFPSEHTGGNPVAVLPPSGSTPGDRPPLDVDRGDLSAVIGGVTNERDYGALKDQSGLNACLRANDLDPVKVQTVGVRQGTLDGRPGIFALLTTGELGQFRLLVVEPTCGADNPGTLANTLLPQR